MAVSSETQNMNSVGETSNSGGKFWIAYIVGAACLLWVFHDVHWRDLFANVRTMNWWLLVPAIAADVASYFAQGARWSQLLRPLARLSILKATQAIYVALFTNEVMPFRVGEVLRSYLASRWTSLSLTQAVSSILAERLLEGAWMALAFGMVVLAVPLPRYLVDAEGTLAAVIVGAPALFIHFIIRKGRCLDNKSERAENPTPSHGGARMSRLIDHAASALASIRGAPSFYAAVVLSGLPLVLQALSFWLVMEAYGMSFSVWHGAIVYLIVRLGTAVPSVPSNIGTYQFFTVLGLLLFDVDKTTATGFSVVVFLILTIPLWIIGLAAFASAGLDLHAIRQEALRLKREWRRPAEVIRTGPAGGEVPGGDGHPTGN